MLFYHIQRYKQYKIQILMRVCGVLRFHSVVQELLCGNSERSKFNLTEPTGDGLLANTLEEEILSLRVVYSIIKHKL